MTFENKLMAQKPSIPKGTRDFSPQEVAKRNYIMNIIKGCFTTYGYQPIETPSFEKSETLMGKYGEEGDRLIFKILNSGDYFKDLRKNLENFGELVNRFFLFLDNYLDTWSRSKEDYNFNYLIISHYETFDKVDKEIIIEFIKDSFELMNSYSKGYHLSDDFAKKAIQQILFQEYFRNLLEKRILNSKNSIVHISEKALRYDLTVPFARYVVQHQNEITFPFKRYQIQPVWRADRPQKGRFREFFQCDADVVGSTSLWQEVELVQLYDDVFDKLNLKGVTIKLNNRKILSGIAEVIGAEDKLIDFTVALDKLDKIGEEGVKTEMLSKGITETALEKLQPLFSLKGSASQKLSELKQMLASSETGLKGIEELEFIVHSVENLSLKASTLEIDVTLARGLNYYTGAIFEVSPPEGVKMGSIGGGGRYDDLTGIFGLKNISGVGISYGLDRIYLVIEELGLFPETVTENTKVLFINFGDKEALYAMQAISKLRAKGITSELYPDQAKMKKQMGYADKRSIPFVVLAGDKEMEAQTFTLKNMVSGEQETVSFEELAAKF